jgi:sugar phosphate isomerase/epimerase
VSADPALSRRSALRAAAGALLGAAAGASGVARAARAQAPRDGGVRLGVASYSLRRFPRDRAIAMVKALGTPYVNVKSFHAEYALPAAELAAARREFEAAGLRIVGGGTITFEQDTDADVRRYFEYARLLGLPVMVSTCEPAILPRVERFARQYDIRVAIHNHGPEDAHYPAPADVLKRVKGMDPRLGLCIDVGHTVRAGADVVQAIADAGPRLLDMHVKDLRDFKDRESQVIVGEGAIPIADVFRQLRTMRYAGFVNLEYEIDADDPLPGMQRSFAYMRGVLAGLASPA